MAKKKLPIIYFYMVSTRRDDTAARGVVGTIRALAEDGTVLDEKTGDDYGTLQKEIGLTAERPDELFAKHYPEGFEMTFIAIAKDSPGLQEAIKLSQSNIHQPEISQVPEAEPIAQAQKTKPADAVIDQIKKEPRFTVKKVFCNVPKEISQDELAMLGTELNDLLNDLDRLAVVFEHSLEELKSEHKANASEKTKEINEIRKQITQRSRSESMTCEVRYDWDADIKRTVRPDTGATIKEEPIAFHERQLAFDLGDGGETGLGKPIGKQEDSEVSKQAENQDASNSGESLELETPENTAPSVETGGQD